MKRNITLQPDHEQVTMLREKPLTVKEVKKVIVEMQKRVRGRAVPEVVMKYGGKVTLPSGDDGPSLKALPAANYAACIAELLALPDSELPLPDLRDCIETTVRGPTHGGLTPDEDEIVLGLAVAIEAFDEHGGEYGDPALTAWIESVHEQMLALQTFLSENYLD